MWLESESKSTLGSSMNCASGGWQRSGGKGTRVLASGLYSTPFRVYLSPHKFPPGKG